MAFLAFWYVLLGWSRIDCAIFVRFGGDWIRFAVVCRIVEFRGERSSPPGWLLSGRPVLYIKKKNNKKSWSWEKGQKSRQNRRKIVIFLMKNGGRKIIFFIFFEKKSSCLGAVLDLLKDVGARFWGRFEVFWVILGVDFDGRSNEITLGCTFEGAI